MAMRSTDDDATLDDLGLDESGGIRALTSQREGAPYAARLLELVARGDGVRPILRGALPQLVAELGAQRGAVLLWRDETPLLEIVGATEVASPLVAALLRLNDDDVAALRTLVESSAMPVTLGPGVPRVNLPSSLLDAALDDDLRYVLLPVGRGDDAVGLLTLGSADPSWPDLARVHASQAELTLLASMLGLRRRLERATADRTAAAQDRQAVLHLWEADSLPNLMQRLARSAAEIANAHTAAAGLVSDGTLVYRDAIVDGQAEAVIIRHRHGRHPQGRVLAGGEAHVHPSPGAPRLCVVPVLGDGGEILAIFEVHARAGRVLAADAPTRLRLLASGVAAVARQLARLDSARGDSAAHTELLPTIRGLARAATADEMYAVLDNLARETFGASAAWLILPPETGAAWQAWTTQPRLRQLAAGEVPLCTIPPSVMDELSELPEPTFVVEDTLSSPLAIGTVASGQGLGSLLGLKLQDGGQTIGVLCIGWAEPARIEPARRTGLLMLRDDVRAAIERRASTPAAEPPTPGAISRLQMLGTIASGVAHGLNNAIGGILGHVDLAFSRDSVDEIRRDLRWVRSSAEQAAETLRRIQIATGVSGASERRQLDVNMLVISAIAIAQHAWAQSADDSAAQLTIETDLRASEPILGNAEQLEEVLQNLIANGAEAMEGEGTITVSTWSADDSSYIQVRDSGPGIPPEVREVLFDPFVSTKAGAGRGLGLAIAAGIVHTHGGEISVETHEHEGTQFTLALPVVGLRILLVEDEPAVRAATFEVLTRAAATR